MTFGMVGLTGTMSAGKGFISAYFKKRGFLFISLSDMIREECKRRGMTTWSRLDLQKVGNELRETEGAGVLGKRALAYAQKLGKPIVIDSIRNVAEIAALRAGKHFFLIGVDAPREMRWKRRDTKRSDVPKTFEEFVQREEQENLGTTHQQHVQLCLKQADLLIWNDAMVNKIEDAPFFQEVRRIADNILDL